jgi:hypothetical protein
MTQLMPTDANQWLRLLGVAFKAMVEDILKDADVSAHLGRYNDGKKSFMIVYLENSNDEDEDICVRGAVDIEDAVTALLDYRYKYRDHDEVCRDVAADFRRLADRIDAAVDAATKKTA